MGDLLRHRGPDSHGVLESPEALLGARRLSIVDLAAEANQPFTSPDGKVWLICNGEIYNAPALRKRYSERGYPFRSRHNDVETILPVYLEYGEDVVLHLEGMFAFAIWDARNAKLMLARDRAGEKPLFFCERSGELRFASEVQALLSLERSTPEISGEGLADYLTLGYCTSPRTLFSGIEKLGAAHRLIADRDGTRVEAYWDPVGFAIQDSPAPHQELLSVFERSVERQLTANVPLGVFTSGGLDSSLLAAEASRRLPPDAVHTYSARFEQATYDESDWASRVCHELGTTHHTVSANEERLYHALDVITSRLAEPVGDPAILPTYLLSEAASHDVKVVLSGEGADELFGGYPTYLGHRWAERFARMPTLFRNGCRAASAHLPVTTRRISLAFLARRFFDEAERPLPDRHLAWFGALGPDDSQFGVHYKSRTLHALWASLAGIAHPVKRAMVFDLLTYLAENLLTKVDRATMLASIEARAPFLDRELMELALRQPLASSVGNIATKRSLKRAALARLPRSVVLRRKQGLSVPVADWINGSLRAEVDDLLSPARLRDQGLLNPAVVGAIVSDHRAGRADWARRIWPLFMLQRFIDRWKAVPSAFQTRAVDLSLANHASHTRSTV